MLNVVVYFLLVGFFTWYIQTQKIFEKIFVGQFLRDLRTCPYCLSFWVSLGFFLIFKMGLLDTLIDTTQILNYIINAIVTSAVISCIVVYLVKGWKNTHLYEIIR